MNTVIKFIKWNLKLKITNTVSVALSGLLAVPYGKQLEKFVSNIIDETPTLYDKAIDKNYNETE